MYFSRFRTLCAMITSCHSLAIKSHRIVEDRNINLTAASSTLQSRDLGKSQYVHYHQGGFHTEEGRCHGLPEKALRWDPNRLHIGDYDMANKCGSCRPFRPRQYAQIQTSETSSSPEHWACEVRHIAILTLASFDFQICYARTANTLQERLSSQTYFRATTSANTKQSAPTARLARGGQECRNRWSLFLAVSSIKCG